ncbi:DNA cytosine methyltransferase [Colwelliaceae bacterium BS250]
MHTTFSLGEFFCGPGGIALGAKLSGTIYNSNDDSFSISPTWASDYDKETCKTYSHNIHETPFDETPNVIHADVTELNIPSLQSCDGFAFGFPCNDFSLVGETKGFKGKFGGLYSYGVSYLTQHQPSWFVAENVGGLSSANEGNAFKVILKDLENAGYKLVSHLYKFHEYGVPQARHRIIIVGIRNNINIEFKVPAPTTPIDYVTAKTAISIPPIPENALNHTKTRQSATVVKRLEYIKPGDNAWSEDIPEHLRLNVKGARLSNIYKRLDPNKPAYTVTGSGGGGTHMYHWDEPRALTNRERARLQTFPDSYHFQGGSESVRKQVGMAVPPVGMSNIFEAILKSFAGVGYEHISPNIK